MSSNDIALTALWDNAVTDQDTVDRLKAVTAATVALAGTWPFLAAAQSREGFEERLALMQESIERTTPPEVLDEVVGRLRTNFVEMHTQRLASQAASHTAARRITAAKADEELPQAFVHVHKHGSGDDEYHQVAWVEWLESEGIDKEDVSYTDSFEIVEFEDSSLVAYFTRRELKPRDQWADDSSGRVQVYPDENPISRTFTSHHQVKSIQILLEAMDPVPDLVQV